MEELVELIDELVKEIPYVEKMLQIEGLAGYALVEDSSGKHQGETRISWRGWKKLRYLLFEASLSLVGKNEEFKELHYYYTHWEENPLKKKKQSLVAVACKFLKIAYKILTTRVDYDGAKMISDIRRPQKQMLQVA